MSPRQLTFIWYLAYMLSICNFNSKTTFITRLLSIKTTRRNACAYQPPRPELLSAVHRSIQLFIFALVAADPTLTVGTTFSIRSAQTNIVSSLNELCSEYGTPKQDASRVEPRCGTSSAIEYKDFQFWLCRMVWMEGESVNL
jgi:hypothetical protein